MKRSAIAPAILAGLAAAACANVEPETLEDVQARALAACPAAIKRSGDAGDHAYSIEDCECIAGRITVPLWSDEDSSYSGDPMPIGDAKAIADAIGKSRTLSEGMEAVEAKISIPSSNSINTCFAKV